MPWAAAAAAVGSIGGALLSSSASSDAADTQANAAKKDRAQRQAMFDKIQGNLDPYMKLGQSALPQLQNLLGLGSGGPGSMFETLKQYPGYQFALQQGMRGVNGDLAVKGLAHSGAQIEGAEKFGQGLASNLFNQYFQQLMQTGQVGANAAAGTNQAGLQTSEGIGQSLLNQGQAQASGIVGSSNAINQGIGGALNNAFTGYQMLNQPSPGGGNTSGGFTPYDTSFMSDPESKTEIEPANDNNLLAQVKRMPTYTYRYKPGHGDGGAERRVGPMADDFAREAGGNGKVIPMPQMIGTLHGAVRSLASQVDELRRAHG